MPRYTFNLKTDDEVVEDGDGIDLPDVGIAYSYACEIVRELMKGREAGTRAWELEVYDSGQEKSFEIAFVNLDQTLDHLDAQTRAIIQGGTRQIRAIKDTFQAVRATRTEARALVARSRGRPYLAVDRGRDVIR